MVRHSGNSAAFASCYYMLPIVISLHTLQNTTQARGKRVEAHDKGATAPAFDSSKQSLPCREPDAPFWRSFPQAFPMPCDALRS